MGYLIWRFQLRKSFAIAKTIFEAHKGILKASQAKQLGIDQKKLSQMLEIGILVREVRGIYRLADLPPLSNPDLIQVSMRVPNGIIFLISALNFYGLTTQIPYKVYMALPIGTKKPWLDYPPLEVYWLSQKTYSSGIEEHIIDGIPVHIYCREKTVADCFKFRNKIGSDIAIEALKDYLHQPGQDINTLMRYARIDRVEKILLPYLKAAL